MAYQALFGPAGPPTLGARAPAAAVDAALTAQGANAAEMKEWHTVELAYNNTQSFEGGTSGMPRMGQTVI